MKLLFVEIKAATRKDIAEYVIRLAKVITISLVPVCYASLLSSILRL